MSAPRRPRPRAVAALPSAVDRRAIFRPTGRSVVAGLVLAACAALAYVVARESAVFAVRTIAVNGAPAPIAAKVQAALAPIAGRSLVALRADDVERLATAVPEVESVSYDRAFPHTLRVVVRLEQPLAVARQGRRSWLVARSGRVIDSLPHGAFPLLPRIWEPPGAVVVGAPLGGGAIAALAPVRDSGLLGRVAGVRPAVGGLTYLLRGGTEVRVGSTEDLLLKLTVARRVLAATAPLAYLDVSIPERPVGTAKPQVSS